MLSTWIKRLLMLIAGLAVAGGLYYAMREKPALVDVAEVVSGPMQVTILQEGTTRVRDIYEISAPIAGHMDRTILEVGDPVKAEETVIAAIHPNDPPLVDTRTVRELTAAREAARAALGIAETDMGRARTNLTLAMQNAERATRLAKTGVIAASALEKLTGEVEVQRAQVESARSAIALRRAELLSAEARLMQPDSLAKRDLDRCCVSLTAPIDGIVLTVTAKSEQPVAVGTRIAEIGDPRQLEIAVDLLSSDAVRVKAGDVAAITGWGGDRALQATLRRIDPAAFTKVSALGIEEQRVNAVFDLDENDPRLGHGFRVYAEIAVWQSPNSLQVPIAALFRNGNDWNAFLIRDGRLAQVKVGIGHMNERNAEVISGLSAGDTVVVHPSDVLADGVAVEIRQ